MRTLNLLNEDCVLNHVALAVENIDKAQKIYEAIGLNFENKREIISNQGVITAFAQMSKDVRLELLEAQGEGAIKTFLEKKGPGVHHLCFRVPNIVEKCHELSQKGLLLVYKVPQRGADNCLINFLHTKSTGGVLIEISQRLK